MGACDYIVVAAGEDGLVIQFGHAGGHRTTYLCD